MPAYRTPLPAMLAASLQTGLNAVLDLDRNSAARMQRIAGRVLKLEMEGTGIELFFTFANQGAGGRGIEVLLEPPSTGPGDGERRADATIRGTPAALFSMAASEFSEGWAAPGSNVAIEGDAGLARDFERLFSRLDPDFESSFSGLFGDVIGHQLAFGLKQGARRARETAGVAREVLGEVLREGSRGGRSGPLIGRDEARRFADDVDRLRDAVERLEARLRLLARRGDDSGGRSS